MIDQKSRFAAIVIDDIVKGIVSSGHPKAHRLGEDYHAEIEGLMEANPNMPLGLATIEALGQILEQSYGIQYHANVADMLDNVTETGMSKEDAEAVLGAAVLIRNGDVAINDESIGTER